MYGSWRMLPTDMLRRYKYVYRARYIYIIYYINILINIV